MDDNKINITEELKYSLNIMHDQSKYAESKNATLIVFTSAMLVGVISSYTDLQQLLTLKKTKLPPLNPNIFQLFIIIFCITLLASTICSIMSFLPQITNKNLETSKEPNLLLFATNANIESSSKIFSYFKDRYSDIDNYNLDIANQVHNLALIAKRKYSWFTRALKALLFGTISDFIICIFVFLF